MRQYPQRVRGVTALAIIAMLVPCPTAAQSPTPETDSEFDPVLATVELMNLAPVGILETCMPTSATVGGAIAAAQCLNGEGVVLYVRFADQGSLEAAYDLLAAPTGMDPDTGVACSDGAFEGEYTNADGSPAGRLLCLLGPDGPMAMWTDPRHTVLGLVQQPPESGYPGLEEAWLAARLPDATTDAGPAATDTAPADTDSEPAPSDAAPAGGATLDQWATSATASSQYGNDPWSAQQATGAPDTTSYGDIETAWAPSGSEVGEQWIELGYDTPVIPSGVLVWETSASGFVTDIEAWDDSSGEWFLLWQGTDDSPDARHGFSPPLEATDIVTDRLRITIDTAVPGWNEIDAVQLNGVTPRSP
jgi:hypothetical protein